MGQQDGAALLLRKPPRGALQQALAFVAPGRFFKSRRLVTNPCHGVDRFGLALAVRRPEPVDCTASGHRGDPRRSRATRGVEMRRVAPQLAVDFERQLFGHFGTLQDPRASPCSIELVASYGFSIASRSRRATAARISARGGVAVWPGEAAFVSRLRNTRVHTTRANARATTTCTRGGHAPTGPTAPGNLAETRSPPYGCTTKAAYPDWRGVPVVRAEGGRRFYFFAAGVGAVVPASPPCRHFFTVSTSITIVSAMSCSVRPVLA